MPVIASSRIHIFDFEVFRYDWLVVCKQVGGTHKVIHNDPEALKEFMGTRPLLGGFNNKGYDNFIIKAICCGADNALVKEINDWIISGKQGFDHWFIKKNRFWFDSFDLRDDMQMGLSLKAIEGHLGMNIQESEVPFDIDRPLTQPELEKTIFYCKHDVDTTEKLLTLRKNYLNGKIQLGNLKNIPPARALYATNAKLTALFLQATAQVHSDEREYKYPENLRKDLIPKEVLAFFDRIHDPNIDSDTLFKSKRDIDIGGIIATFGFGGVHAGLKNIDITASGDTLILNFDVTSLYPSLMILFGYISRNIPSPEVYVGVYNDRVVAKKAGDKDKSNTLKLPLNTAYGAMLNKYNPLYDPLMARSVCISGQLFLTELACHLSRECKSIRMIQLNTDGIMFTLDKSEYQKALAINAEWEKRTGFELEEDRLTRVVQKDVNNYAAIFENGKIKTKGGYLTYGIAPAGAFNINNNAVIVKKATLDYLVKGIDPAKTIGDCDDLLEFQMIAKAGAKYKEARYTINGVVTPIQKVNRVYATSDTKYGTLHKVKFDEDGDEIRCDKIDTIPEHCLIDNANCLSIADIDKQWYVALAWKRINDYLGVKTEKVKSERKSHMVTTKKTSSPLPDEVPVDAKGMNLFGKLLAARTAFLESNVKKSGVNRHLEFDYFELADIVPPANAIFKKYGLVPLVSFTKEEATMRIVNVDDPTETEVFTSPMVELEPNKGTNPIQALGSVETYQRRYLYLMALDIVEHDALDNAAGAPETVAKPQPSAPKTSVPASQAEREATKSELTSGDKPADAVQIESLKNILKQLREVDPSKEKWIAELKEKTNGFTNLTRKVAEDLIIAIGDMVAKASA